MNPPPAPSGRSHFSRREFLRTGSAAALSGLILGARGLAAPEPAAAGFHLPLQDATGLTLDGPYRFLTVAGRTGFQPTSLHTKATVSTDVPRGPTGSLSFWFSPLENAGFHAMSDRMQSVVPDATVFPLVSDTFPARNRDQMTFGVYWTSGYPQFVGKCAGGGIWEQLDFDIASFVYAERLTLRTGAWYHVVLTWDRPRHRLRLHVNGRLMGWSDIAEKIAVPAGVLHLGNPMMIMRDLRIEPVVLEDATIRARYAAQLPAGNGTADEDIRLSVDVVERPPLDLVRDGAWQAAYATDFTRQADVDQWVFQTGDEQRGGFTVKSTPEGLLVRTPDNIAKESRMYLWSPRSFEGDQWIEYDFRPESKDGLSLLTVCCRGPQREDFLLDRAMEKTGAMNIILGKTLNYHWEYVRRVEIMRRDVETQYLAKNPWSWKMHYGCIPRLEEDRWHRLRFIKAGPRLHGSIDGRTVFDVTDDGLGPNGPALNFGRIGLRQMYKTTMRYRDLHVWTRHPGMEAAG